jgi:hypothetical protein
MNETQSLFEAERRRDDGMKSSDRHARSSDPAWRALFIAFACELAATGIPFGTDDVFAKVGQPSSADPRASGSIMKMLRAQGVIEATGEYRMSRSTSRQMGVSRLWRGKRAEE